MIIVLQYTNDNNKNNSNSKNINNSNNNSNNNNNTRPWELTTIILHYTN